MVKTLTGGFRNLDITEGQSIRINRYISDSGFCSRREADKMLLDKKVTINGKFVDIGSKVFPGDIVKISGKMIQRKKDYVYIAFNKPVGITCTTEKHIRGNIVDYVNHKERIFPIGRLDKDSEGLIFLTNDGEIVNKILRAGNSHEKEYVVTVDKPITKGFLEGMANGVPIEDKKTLPCQIKQEGKSIFRIILIEGRNRQIRKMCAYFGYEVKKLKRVRIMNVVLGKLPIGKWRNLTKEELAGIQKLTVRSKKTI